MKKFSILLFSLFYLTVASGMTMSIHYCGGKFKSLSLIDKRDEDGCCGNKKKSKGCCKDKTAHVKVKDNQKLSETFSITLHSVKIVRAEFSIEKLIFYSKNTDYYPLNYHAPPVLYDNPLYLKHRVFLI